MQRGGIRNVLLQALITGLHQLLGGLWAYSFTFEPMEDGHNRVLSTMLTFKVSDSCVRSSWRYQTLDPSCRSFCLLWDLFCFSPSNEATEGGRDGFVTVLRCTAHTLPDGPVCVGAASPCWAPPRRPAGAHCSRKLARNAVKSHHCGRQLQTAPLQASSVRFDFFFSLPSDA